MISVKGQLQCADLMQRKQNFGLVLIYYSLLSNYIKNEKLYLSLWAFWLLLQKMYFETPKNLFALKKIGNGNK